MVRRIRADWGNFGVVKGAWGPVRFGVVALLAAMAMLLVPLAVHRFDVTAFINAGDEFVARAAVPVPIAVRRNSGGYDGQFYFRLALNPDTRRRTENGITFDNAPWRMQRILYPAIVHVLSAPDLRLVPYMLVAVNLAGLFFLAFFARLLAVQAHLPGWFAIAVMAWPGYLITLEHDTTEIVAAAFLAGAVWALLARRYAAYAVLAGCATLTRETSILLFGGIFAAHGLDWLASAVRARSLAWGKAARVGLCLLALVPFLVWRQVMTLRWGQSPGAAGSTLLDWPVKGLVLRLAECFGVAHGPVVAPFASRLESQLVVVTLAAFAGVIALVLVRLRRVPVWDVRIAGLALGWALVAMLHLSMNAVGWDHMTGYLRGCTEFWFASVVLVALSGFQVSRVQAIGGLGVAAIVMLGNLS